MRRFYHVLLAIKAMGFAVAEASPVGRKVSFEQGHWAALYCMPETIGDDSCTARNRPPPPCSLLNCSAPGGSYWLQVPWCFY